MSLFFFFFWFNHYKQDIDGEVAQHLKRLSRKDPTTKVMHLQIPVQNNITPYTHI